MEDMIYRCDDCKKIFMEKEATFQPFAKNFRIFAVSVLVHNMNTGKNYFSSTDNITDGDCSIHCPHCNKVHLFGFDRA